MRLHRGLRKKSPSQLHLWWLHQSAGVQGKPPKSPLLGKAGNSSESFQLVSFLDSMSSWAFVPFLCCQLSCCFSGKNVTFSILYVVSSINRTFGEVFLVGPDGESTSVAKVIAAAGWATVKDSRDASRLCSDHSELGPLEAAAKVAKQGMFANPKSAITRNINWNPNTAALEDLLQKAQAQTTNPGVVRVVIEGVRDGATLRVCVIGPGNTFTYASLFMAGVMCPRAGSGSAAGSGATGGAGASAAAASASENEGGDDENDEAPAAAVSSSSGSSAEPYGLQAKVFSELRLLNRELDVKLFAVDARANALVGTVLHPKGDIAGEILKNGLGKLAERTVTYVSKSVIHVCSDYIIFVKLMRCLCIACLQGECIGLETSRV